MSHTPGPWAVFKNGNVIDSTGTGVAAVYRGAVGLQAANARLIAAAPDMLDALIAFDNAVDSNGGMPEFPNIRSAVQLARAAIKKATNAN